jgi:DNA/RNA-binding domain of Phe-tRNA-synthetase-like protein
VDAWNHRDSDLTKVTEATTGAQVQRPSVRD